MTGNRLALAAAAAMLALPSMIPRLDDGSGRAAAQEAAYKVRSTVVGCAGAPSSSAGFRANGTLAQPTPIGIGSAAGTIVYAGFWGRYYVLTDAEKPPTVYANALFQNYPNPFNPATIIKYSLKSAGAVEIAIFNVNGQRVRRLISEVKAAGVHEAIWDGTNDRGGAVTSGIYFYRLTAGSYESVRKMLLLR